MKIYFRMWDGWPTLTVRRHGYETGYPLWFIPIAALVALWLKW